MIMGGGLAIGGGWLGSLRGLGFGVWDSGFGGPLPVDYMFSMQVL